MNGARSDLKSTTELWRYMDLARFLALIDLKKLYFPRPHEFEDGWEAALSPLDPLFDGPDAEYMKLEAAYAAASAPMVSCWHENDTESVAMWKLYLSGGEGVAIKTTVSSLVQQFSIGRELKIGRVAYRDVDDFEYSPDVFAFEGGHDKGEAELEPVERAIFRKNRAYTHEQEVRLVIYDAIDVHQAVLSGGDLHDSIMLQCGVKPAPPAGVSMPVDISTLIQRIVVSPAFPSWAITTLQKTVDAAFAPSQPVTIETSVLLNKPSIGKHQVVANAP